MAQRQFIALLSLLLILLPFSLTRAGNGPGPGEVSLTIPAQTLSGLLRDALPIEISKEGAFSGLLMIQSIEDLHFGNNTVSFSAVAQAQDLQFSIEVGKTPVLFKIGTVRVPLQCTAQFRYDKATQKLHLKPEIREKTPADKSLVKALSTVLIQNEFLIEIQKLKPLVTQVAGKPLVLNMDIADIYSSQDTLFVILRPSIETKK